MLLPMSSIPGLVAVALWSASDGMEKLSLGCTLAGIGILMGRSRLTLFGRSSTLFLISSEFPCNYW